MNKKSLIFFIAIFLLISLTFSIVSASAYGDFFKKITGKATVLPPASKCGNPSYGSCTGVTCSNGQSCYSYTEQGTGQIVHQCCSGGAVTAPSGNSGNSENVQTQSSIFSSSLNNFMNKLRTAFGLSKKIQFYSCYDSEGSPQNPPNPQIKGYITVNYTENNGPMQTQIVYDSCVGTVSTSNRSMLNEYWCKTSTLPVKDVITCEIGKQCQDGACVGGLTCNDTDNGKNYPLYGDTIGYEPFEHTYSTYGDACSDENVLTEGYCDNVDNTVGREYYVCPQGCSAGVCVEPSLTGNASTCTDSDNGINAVVKGSATGPDAQWHQQNVNINDVCNVDIFGKAVLTEAYCQSNGQVSTIDIPCPNGCGNGVCNPTTGSSNCVDSDAGINYAVQGMVVGNQYGLNGITFTDTCLTNQYIYPYQNFLKEYYCDNNQIAFTNQICDGGCANGACVPLNLSNQGNGGNIQQENLNENQSNLEMNVNKIQSKNVINNIPNVRYKF